VAPQKRDSQTKDKDKNENKDQNEGKNKSKEQQKNQDKNNQKDNQEQDETKKEKNNLPKPTQAKQKKDYDNLLDAVNNEELKVQQKVNGKKMKQPIKTDKDW
jgi:hypothetical protein